MPGYHPSIHARTRPDTLAMLIADTGETMTYRELDEGSNRVAQLLRSRGLRPGDRNTERIDQKSHDGIDPHGGICQKIRLIIQVNTDDQGVDQGIGVVPAQQGRPGVVGVL